MNNPTPRKSPATVTAEARAAAWDAVVSIAKLPPALVTAALALVAAVKNDAGVNVAARAFGAEREAAGMPATGNGLAEARAVITAADYNAACRRIDAERAAAAKPDAVTKAAAAPVITAAEAARVRATAAEAAEAAALDAWLPLRNARHAASGVNSPLCPAEVAALATLRAAQESAEAARRFPTA
jgi:hypothetical protein